MDRILILLILIGIFYALYCYQQRMIMYEKKPIKKIETKRKQKKKV